ncbi:MAG TPA: hypothetical protein VG266_07895 [Candidatus Dormibacteraeota bacterium]|jgi:hypothetical protein|nr:hypothetical protein [Candidatus Dormibacteraeota bacterium]
MTIMTPTLSLNIDQLAAVTDAMAQEADEMARRRLDALHRLADVVSEAARRDLAMARLEAALFDATPQAA